MSNTSSPPHRIDPLPEDLTQSERVLDSQTCDIPDLERELAAELRRLLAQVGRVSWLCEVLSHRAPPERCEQVMGDLVQTLELRVYLKVDDAQPLTNQVLKSCARWMNKCVRWQQLRRTS